MTDIQAGILVPVAAGLLLFLVTEKAKLIKGIIALTTAVISSVFALRIFFSEGQIIDFGLRGFGNMLVFRTDSLSRLILLFIVLFSVVILLYSIIYIKNRKSGGYYSWFLVTMGCSIGAVLADNLMVFLAFWGILGITLYKLIPGTGEESSATAKKTLILIGASDSIMIIGIAILWKITGSLNMSGINVPTGNIVEVAAFLALLAGSFTKAGAFPFHTWVPDYAKDAPAASSAYLPASLDKLLGIYFLSRIVHGLFVPGEWMTLLLLTLGVVTIITAVMMALIQHNYKQLLGYHAVSQVGYMIVGLSLGSLLGAAAGLFHMVNNAMYKSGLFLSAGAIEYRTGKDNIDDLGGLSRAMPVTFFAALIFAVSISGVPPLNGFASKWMIYQAIIDFGSGAGLANKLWVLWLGLAVLGSALTLASFIKFIGGVFLGRRRPELENVKEVPCAMWIPLVLLALLCIFFGVFATTIVVPRLFVPVTGIFTIPGFWDSGMVSLMVLVSIILGVIIYLLWSFKKARMADSFIGGEKFYEEAGYPTPEFYKSFGEFRLISAIYKRAEEKWFDIYDLTKNAVLRFSRLLSEAHGGVLPGYIIWVFAGLLIMLLIML